jgi:hypothetical protein
MQLATLNSSWPSNQLKNIGISAWRKAIMTIPWRQYEIEAAMEGNGENNQHRHENG